MDPAIRDVLPADEFNIRRFLSESRAAEWISREKGYAFPECGFLPMVSRIQSP